MAVWVREAAATAKAGAAAVRTHKGVDLRALHSVLSRRHACGNENARQSSAVQMPRLCVVMGVPCPIKAANSGHCLERQCTVSQRHTLIVSVWCDSQCQGQG